MARSGKPTQTVQELLEHPYVKRALEDPEVRDNAKAAYESAQAAYERLRKVGSPAAALFDDRKLQRELRTTGKSIASTREGLKGEAQAPPRALPRADARSAPRWRSRFSEGLRNKVLDALFGAEEEFDYVSTTAPPAPAPRPRHRPHPRRRRRRPRRMRPRQGDRDARRQARRRGAKNASSSAEPAATSGD